MRLSWTDYTIPRFRRRYRFKVIAKLSKLIFSEWLRIISCRPNKYRFRFKFWRWVMTTWLTWANVSEKDILEEYVWEKTYAMVSELGRHRYVTGTSPVRHRDVTGTSPPHLMNRRALDIQWSLLLLLSLLWDIQWRSNGASFYMSW